MLPTRGIIGKTVGQLEGIFGGLMVDDESAVAG